VRRDGAVSVLGADDHRNSASAPALSPAHREQAVRSLQDGEVDVLVVGGGVVGTGAALDAASRGLRAGLVEATDFASGASSESSKLVHGGVRYLQMLDFALVREALAERALLLRLAPHLVRPVPFLYPLRHRVWERTYVAAGLTIYDLLALLGSVHGGGQGQLPRQRQLSRRSTLRLAPGLRPEVVRGGIEYWDAQVDDARFVVDLARTAAGLGAELLTGARAVGFLDGDAHKVRGVRVRLEGGRELEVRAKAVLAATGAWSGELQRLAGRGGTVALRPSKGVHLVVPRTAIRSQRALVVPTGRSVLFVLPWGAHWLVGTTDTAWRPGPDHPVANRGDIEYLLAEANKVLEPGLGERDIEAVYAGLRPLVAVGDAETAKLSREHAVSRLRPGLYMITGGKYTTYRVMARDAIDALAGELGRHVARSATDRVPLVGARGSETAAGELVRAFGIGADVAEHLARRYGGLAGEVLDPAASDPSLLETLPDGAGYLKAEARYAASHEGARHLDDVIERRLRLSIETSDRGWRAAPAVAEQLAPVLGWDDDDVRRELDSYRHRVEAARLAERQPDDEAAYRAVAGLERGASA
jgi:glycerol-3-phosphate dehydrogenase